MWRLGTEVNSSYQNGQKVKKINFFIKRPSFAAISKSTIFQFSSNSSKSIPSLSRPETTSTESGSRGKNSVFHQNSSDIFAPLRCFWTRQWPRLKRLASKTTSKLQDPISFLDSSSISLKRSLKPIISSWKKYPIWGLSTISSLLNRGSCSRNKALSCNKKRQSNQRSRCSSGNTRKCSKQS